LTTELRQFDPHGWLIGVAHVPVELTKVFEIGLHYVLGAYEDMDGEPAVVLYRLRRGR
jgi:hypothetical protein